MELPYESEDCAEADSLEGALDGIAGLEVREARQRLEALGLITDIQYRHNRLFPEDCVYYVLPESGITLRCGDTVTLFVSLGA